jgi:hypothetical protein
MKKRVFISSTFIDLIPHRQSIWELLQSFNVSVSGMERFGARTEVPLETCLTEVQNSDIFISIIGMRYGSIEEESNKSYSQLEYEKAKELNKEIYVYILDENAETKVSLVDFENYQNLSQFKTILRKNHTVDTFLTEKDLVKKINDNLKINLNPQDINNSYRPKKISCVIEKFKIDNDNWLVVLGSKFGSPFEIFVGKIPEGFTIPNYLKEGWIIKSGDSRGEYDLQFLEQQGYRITFEGLSRFSSNLISKLVSKLLEKNVSTKDTIEIIEAVDFNFGDSEIAIKRAINKMLSST